MNVYNINILIMKGVNIKWLIYINLYVSGVVEPDQLHMEHQQVALRRKLQLSVIHHVNVIHLAIQICLMLQNGKRHK